MAILGSITAASRLCPKEASQGEPKKWEDQGSKHKGEEAQDHGILN